MVYLVNAYTLPLCLSLCHTEKGSPCFWKLTLRCLQMEPGEWNSAHGAALADLRAPFEAKQWRNGCWLWFFHWLLRTWEELVECLFGWLWSFRTWKRKGRSGLQTEYGKQPTSFHHLEACGDSSHSSVSVGLLWWLFLPLLTSMEAYIPVVAGTWVFLLVSQCWLLWQNYGIPYVHSPWALTSCFFDDALSNPQCFSGSSNLLLTQKRIRSILSCRCRREESFHREQRAWKKN